MKYLKTFESFELIEENKDSSYIYNHLTDNIDPLDYESFSKYYQACVDECGSNVPSDIDEFCKDCWEERGDEELRLPKKEFGPAYEN